MSKGTKDLLALVETYKGYKVEFAHLKAVTLAMWILESGWGTSDLAVKYGNYGGLKYRPEMEKFAKKVRYAAHDGEDDYCAFASHDDFIGGFWAFLDRDPYEGWRQQAGEPRTFIRFIGPVYVGGEAAGHDYAVKVLALLDEAESLLGADGGEAFCCDGKVSTAATKPEVDRFEATSHRSSRDTFKIDHVVLHYTTSSNIEGTISHFKKGIVRNGKLIRTSAHYIVGRDGELVQMVNDSHASWHAGSSTMNKRSIGIEHVAQPGDRLTPQQSATSIQLIRWLLEEYNIPRKNVIPHDHVKSTSCPGDLFSAYGSDHQTAIQAWLKDKLDQPILAA